MSSFTSISSSPVQPTFYCKSLCLLRVLRRSFTHFYVPKQIGNDSMETVEQLKLRACELFLVHTHWCEFDSVGRALLVTAWPVLLLIMDGRKHPVVPDRHGPRELRQVRESVIELCINAFYAFCLHKGTTYLCNNILRRTKSWLIWQCKIAERALQSHLAVMTQQCFYGEQHGRTVKFKSYPTRWKYPPTHLVRLPWRIHGAYASARCDSQDILILLLCFTAYCSP